MALKSVAETQEEENSILHVREIIRYVCVKRNTKHPVIYLRCMLIDDRGFFVDTSAAVDITMDMEMQWDGNPNIVLDTMTKVGVALPIQSKAGWVTWILLDIDSCIS